ncbi:unnamed protein product [Prorocentrum cordatum]|uniref:Uncharacterized protein n=1 Tax=Prorocentrum cordatum TaxID=2364126 RepID=A0ABN9WRC6_9DINO|nr:unnamed protein product [Polarella glacialis]
MAREPLRGAAGARAAANRLFQRLVQELSEARLEIERLKGLLVPAGGVAPGSWRDRELAARPALQAAAAGARVCGRRRRRRNAAWHALRVPVGGFTTASDAAIAEVAAGPRLGAFGGLAAREPVECIVEICLAEAAVVLLRLEVEVCAAEPAGSRPVGAPARRTPLRSAAMPYIPKPPGVWGRLSLQPSSDEIAKAVLKGLGRGPLAPLDRAEPGPPREGGWKAGSEPGPPREGGWKADAGGAAGAGTPPPPLAHPESHAGAKRGIAVAGTSWWRARARVSSAWLGVPDAKESRRDAADDLQSEKNASDIGKDSGLAYVSGPAAVAMFEKRKKFVTAIVNRRRFVIGAVADADVALWDFVYKVGVGRGWG